MNSTPASKAPFKKPWSTTVKDADMERILERLDRILRDVEQLADHIAERLGLELSDGDTTEEYDTEEDDQEDLPKP